MSLKAIELAEKVEKEISDHLPLLKLSEGKDIVAVLGNTGSGKSTTLNWLAGKKLVVGPRKKILLEDESDPTAMAIGSKCEAMTKYPCSITIDGLVFFDLPGFRDTGGMACDLINAAFIKGILENARSVKVMFFAGQDEVTGSRGELLKKLLEGVDRLFDRESKVINDYSLLVITKSDEENVADLTVFLKEEISSQYHEHLDGWISKKRLFQVKKPSGGKICYDGRDDIMKALSCAGQKVSHVNVNAIYPDCVGTELTDIFSGIFSHALASYTPNPDETMLSSLLEAIDFVKGDVDDDNYSINFWRRFGEHVRQNPSVKVLRPLSNDSFEKALELFQNARIDTMKRTVSGWKAKYVLVYNTIQNQTVARIEVVAANQFDQLRKILAFERIADVNSGEQKQKQLQCALKSDVKSTVLKAVDEDLEIKRIVDKDPSCNTGIVTEARNRFSEAPLRKMIDDYMNDVRRASDLVGSQIETLKLQSDIREKMDSVRRLSDQVEEERKEKERLNKEIEDIRSRSSASNQQFLKLMRDIALQNKARKEYDARRALFFSSMCQPACSDRSALDYWDFEDVTDGMSRMHISSPKKHKSPKTHVSSSSSSSPRPKPSWADSYKSWSSGKKTQKEIAEEMGCSQPTVSRHFKKFKK